MNKRKVFDVVVLLILSLVPLIWFHDNTLLLGHDSGFRLNPSNHLYNLLFSWNSINNFGTDWSIFKGFIITQFPEFFFTFITHSIYWGQRLTLIFWFFTMILSMYLFINEFFYEGKYWFFRIFSSVFYVYNFFILQAWFIAERSKFSVYTALPLGFLVIYKTLSGKLSLLKGTAFFALIFFFFNGGGNIPVFGGLLLTYIIVFMYFIVASIYKKSFSNFTYIAKVAFFFISATIFINFYWFLPQIFLALSSYATKLSANGGVNGILSWEETISKNASLLNLFRLQGIPDWYDVSHPFSSYYFNNPFLIVFSCIPFIIILLGFTLIGIKKNKKIEYIDHLLKIVSIIFIVGFVFNGGTHPPLGFIYEWIITHIPGFAIFRSSYYKFSPMVFFSYAILFGYFLDAIYRKYIRNVKIFTFVAICTITVVLVYNFPFFTINFFLFNKPFTTKISPPTYVENMFTYINTHVNSHDPILLAPELDPTIGEDSYTWGYWSLDFLPRIALQNPIIASDANTTITNNLYQSIHKGDEKLFLELAQKAGIHYLLWRNDVLYNDKVTSGRSLDDEKKHLDNFTSLHEVYLSGAWKLYALPQTDSLFTTTPFVYTFHGDDMNLADLMTITQTPVKQTSWITSSTVDIRSNNGGNIFENSCKTCDTESIEDQAKQLAISSGRILPWSKLYFLIQWRENRQLQQTTTSPNQRIDVDLSLSSKRISEIWQMGYVFFSQKTAYFSEINEKKYESLINDATSKINLLTTDDKILYERRTIDYLNFHKKYLQPALQNNQIKSIIEHMRSFIDKKITNLNQQLWISPTNDDKKSYITIPQTGDYIVSLLSDVTSPGILFIDNNEIDLTKHISLTAGNHSTEVKFPFLDNLINVDYSNNSMKRNKPVTYDIHNFSYSSTYAIQFSYTLHPQTKVDFEISQNNNENQLKGVQSYPLKARLIDDAEEHQFSYEYHPDRGIQKASVMFMSDKDTNLEIRNFTIQQVTNPRIYITKNISAQNENTPSIIYQKINDTRYIVSVKNAKNPYLLTFNQTFSNSWNLTSANEIPLNALHVEVNGYSNGWYVTKKGNYALLVEYVPQNYFYFSSAISLISLGVCSFIILKKKSKN